MKIKILASASRDLIEGYHFYEMQADGVGAYFLDSLYSRTRNGAGDRNGAGALLICVLGSMLSGYSATAVVCPSRQ